MSLDPMPSMSMEDMVKLLAEAREAAAAAERARAAEQAEREKERERREQAEKAAAAAEKAAAAAERARAAEQEEREKEREGRERAEKEREMEREGRLKDAERNFETLMDREAAPAPSSTHDSTGKRQRRRAEELYGCAWEDTVGVALLPDDDGDGDGDGDVATRDETEAWAGAITRIRGMDFPTSADGPFEVTVVRMVMAALLEAALLGCDSWRYWCDKKVPDDVPHDEAKPDHSFTHVRDAQLSLLGALLMVEDKRPGALAEAVSQALQYGRRRVQKLYYTAKDVGCALEELAAVSTLVVATDVRSLCIGRVRSGCPRVRA
jgi:hypothetical protein